MTVKDNCPGCALSDCALPVQTIGQTPPCMSPGCTLLSLLFFYLGFAASIGLSLCRFDRAGHTWIRDAPMYWLVSLPLLDDSEECAWTLVQNRTTYESDLSSNYKFVLPELRVGTLDSLMVLSDDLVKVNGLVESVVNKVRRQLFEMGAVNGSDSQEARPCPAVAITPWKSSARGIALKNYYRSAWNSGGQWGVINSALVTHL